ncbi:ATP-binding protein [Stappia sp. F7233]|uniref:ATP-binding protein n=1 Tax=Stappia albiluteola TaxID=2758565 RepID=A0A839AGW7_9HYPH|nr:ATP-binding protein [Stappia albiluteola]MBA5778174.1 ATP-binding protein [Stappia albiluteola]
MTIRIDMGRTSSGETAEMDLEELLATRLLVQGNSGSGKSHLLRRLLEQSAPWVQQCIIDPEGDFVTLSERFGHVVIDAAGAERDLAIIGARVRQHRVSTILNLEGLEPDRQMKAAAVFLNALFDADRDYWYPMLVVVDEAQLFAPSASGEAAEEARRASLGAMTNLMCRGRKRGLAGIIATQRLAKLAKNVAAEASNFLMGRTFLDIDMARAADLLGMEKRQAETFRDLGRGHFVALGPALYRRPVKVTIGTVETTGRGGGPKLTPLPETPAENVQELLFQPATESERIFVERKPAPPVVTGDILERLNRHASGRDREPDLALAETVDDPERDAAIQKVMTDLMAEPEAAFQPIAALYQDFQVRLRIARIPGQVPDLQAFRELVAFARAGVDQQEIDTGEWAKAEFIAESVPQDMRGVFLLIAGAAARAEPCPSDEAIARAYGTRSLGRARWLLTHLEERGFIVCASDMRGNRVVSMPDLGWQTAPQLGRAAG